MYKSGIMTVAGKFLKNISQMIIFVQKYVKKNQINQCPFHIKSSNIFQFFYC